MRSYTLYTHTHIHTHTHTHTLAYMQINTTIGTDRLMPGTPFELPILIWSCHVYIHAFVVVSFFKDFIRQILNNCHFPHVCHMLLLSHGLNLDKTTSGGIKDLKIMTSGDNSHFGVMLPTRTPQTSIINHYCTYLLKSRYDKPSHHNTERPQSADRRDGLCIQIAAACTSIL